MHNINNITGYTNGGFQFSGVSDANNCGSGEINGNEVSREELIQEIQRGSLSQRVLERLLPRDFKQACDENKPGNSSQWKEFDKSLLEGVLDALKHGRIETVESKKGEKWSKIQYNNPFEAILHERSKNIEKSKIIYEAFANHFSNPDLNSEETEVLHKKIFKYVDYIGKNNKNIKKILLNSNKTKKIFGDTSLENTKKNKILDDFLYEISEKMGKAEVKGTGINNSEKKVIAITTSTSGGAHQSIAAAVESGLDQNGVSHKLIKTNELVQDDNLQYFIGMPRKDAFNKVSQQSSEMTYGKQLKLLDGYLNQFRTDMRVVNLVKAVGESSFVYSTSHHAEDVVTVAENNAKICFQVCDYGQIPDKLENIAKTVAKYKLSGIKFFVPSENSTLRLSSKSDLIGRPSYDKNQDVLSQVSGYNTNLQSRYRNYSKAIIIHQYPIKKDFVEELTEDKRIVFKEKYGLRKDADLWVLTMGSQGMSEVLKGYLEHAIDGFVQDVKRNEGFDLDIVVLCGRNEAMRKELADFCDEKISRLDPTAKIVHSRLKFNFLGFVPNEDVALFGKASKAFLSKPGGGTAAEALTGGFPMVIHKQAKAPWEDGNITELEKSNAQLLKDQNEFYQAAKSAKKLEVKMPLSADKFSVPRTLATMIKE